MIRKIYHRKKEQTNIVVFLDRDGTIIKETHFLLREKQISFYASAIKALQTFHNLRITVIILSNQPGVARGLLSEEQVIALNNKIVAAIEKAGGKVHAFYACPHHPEATLPAYRVICTCRKPNDGMIAQANKDFALTGMNCYVVGDRMHDIAMGKKAGCTTLLVQTGSKMKEKNVNVTPDKICYTLYQAARFIAQMH